MPVRKLEEAPIQASNIRFAKSAEPFYIAMSQRVREHFANNEKSAFATTRMIGKAIVQATLLIGLYTLMISDEFTGWPLFFIQLGFYFSIFLVSVGIAHDGSHHAYSRRRWVNHTLCMVFDLIGINSLMWEFNHIKSHHRLPNVPKYDSAIDSFALFRLHPRADHHAFHRFQHIYIPVIYSISTLFKIFILDFYSFGRKKIGMDKIESHSYGAITWLILTKAFVISYSLVIPLLLLSAPTWQILAGFFCGHLLAGLTLGVVFMVTHISDHSVWPEPDEDGLIQNSFARHVLDTTSDFCPQNRLVTWISGGLNNHVAHHLFPNISQIHLPQVTRIVQQTAMEFGVPYKEYPSVIAALRSHLIALKELGRSYEGNSAAQWKETSA